MCVLALFYCCPSPSLCCGVCFLSSSGSILPDTPPSCAGPSGADAISGAHADPTGSSEPASMNPGCSTRGLGRVAELCEAIERRRRYSPGSPHPPESPPLPHLRWPLPVASGDAPHREGTQRPATDSRPVRGCAAHGQGSCWACSRFSRHANAFTAGVLRRATGLPSSATTRGGADARRQARAHRGQRAGPSP